MATAQAKRTHCPQGHPYDEANTLRSSGRRVCRACGRARQQAKHRPQPTSIDLLIAEIGKFDARWELAEDGCWVWTGSKHNAGYGAFGKPPVLAHRWSYEIHIGPIPDGLTIDHLCRNRRCVNPWHLEPVTIAENVMRGEGFAARNAHKTHCPQGHPYDEENTYVNPNSGWRLCRTCNRERARLLRSRRGGGAT